MKSISNNIVKNAQKLNIKKKWYFNKIKKKCIVQ